MDFWDLTKLLVRQWMIAVPMLILSGALIWLTFNNVKPDYVATAYVQLVPPVLGPTVPGKATPEQRNPWLGLGLQTIGNAANVSVLDKTFAKDLETTGYSETFTSTMDPSTPLITMEVVGDTQPQARQTADLLVQRFTESVATLQSTYGVSPGDSITARRLDLGRNVEESNSKVKRALVAVAGVGLLMTAAVTVGVDAWLRRRRRRVEPATPAKPPIQKQAANDRRPPPEAAVALRPTPTDQMDEDAPTTFIPITPMPVTAGGGTDGGSPTVTVTYESANRPKPAEPAPSASDKVSAPAPVMEPADTTIVLPLFLPRAEPSPGANGDKKPRR